MAIVQHAITGADVHGRAEKIGMGVGVSGGWSSRARLQAEAFIVGNLMGGGL
jgi:hypothetical protein